MPTYTINVSFSVNSDLSDEEMYALYSDLLYDYEPNSIVIFVPHNNIRYSVYKTISMTDYRRAGVYHGSTDAKTTLCGLNINSHWYISHNQFDGPITCKECLNMPL